MKDIYINRQFWEIVNKCNDNKLKQNIVVF